MKDSNQPTPRAHHFVPQCWLMGFTETGYRDGKLWVTDLKRRKQWPSNPAKAGHRRDFYKVSTENADPIGAEKLFSKIEAAAAPILKKVDENRRIPTSEELEILLFFMAVQWVRVPAFRPTVLAIADSHHRSKIAAALKTQQSWLDLLREAGISSEDPTGDYEQMLAFEKSGQYSLSASTEWYLLRGLEGVNTIHARLKERHWGIRVSQKGSFVGSDNPIAMDGPEGSRIGFKNADIVTYPLSRHVLLYGTRIRVRPPFVNQMFIAHTNSFAMLTADEQIYSAAPDFCWLDPKGEYQTDWKKFSREKYNLSMAD